jgi:hypothetical protein
MSVLSLNADSIFPKVIRIGYEGENVVTQIDFNLKMWIAEYGLGGVTLLVLRHGDTNAYPVPLMIEDGIASWVITKTDTAKVGRGAIQLKYVVEEKIKKSPIFDISCLNALDDSDTVPDPYDSWLATLTDLSTLVTAKVAESLVNADIAQMAANISAQAASQSAKSADAAEKSELNALESAQASKSEADKSKIYAEQAQGALGGMTFVGFSMTKSGHVLITNSDRLGTTSFELTQEGHMEVTY